jgi:transposase-like protein
VTGERPVKFVWASIVARSETTRSNRRPGQPKAATTNRVRDYQALEREYLTGAMSLRELCRAHGITAHSAVMVQARQGGWAEKRETYRARASAKYIEHRADHAALREAEVRDHAIDAIDEAITKFRSDLRATKKVVLADGSVAEEPAMRITPRDLVMVIDRLQVLFGRPSTISEGRGFAATVTTEALPLDAL